MHKKPELSVLQIWNMCFGFLGIQIGFALQNANVSRIFQTLGAAIEDLPILWVAAPVTGLLVQPIIGYMSDNTWNRLGRRRPYFLAGALLASFALLFMPNSPGLWIAAGMLWIMDASINIAMEPFRAFVGDMLPERQRTLGFAMQSFFISVGAVLASAAPWMLTNWLEVANTAPPGQVPDSVRFSFYIGGAALLLAVMWTVISTREYPPEQLQAYSENAQDRGVAAPRPAARSSGQYRRGGFIWMAAGLALLWAISRWQLDKELLILGAGLALFGLLQWISAALQDRRRTDNGFYQIVDDLFHMPKTMRQLAVVQFFSWFAFFAFWIYTTPAVTDYHYGTRDTASALYNEGANWVGVLMAAYNVFAALAAFSIPLLARYSNRRVAHMVSLTLGSLGLLSFVLFKDPGSLLISTIGVGIAWASTVSVPYSILSSALPAKKMGVYMGIFNFFIVIPQILAASVLGFLLKVFFDGEPIYALVMGGVSMLLGGIAVLLVEETPAVSAAPGLHQPAA